MTNLQGQAVWIALEEKQEKSGQQAWLAQAAAAADAAAWRPAP